MALRSWIEHDGSSGVAFSCAATVTQYYCTMAPLPGAQWATARMSALQSGYLDYCAIQYYRSRIYIYIASGLLQYIAYILLCSTHA